MKKTISYTDARGRPHHTAEAATVSDLSTIFTTEKTPSGAATEIAKVILAKRAEIERIFKEHDVALDPDA